MLNVTNTVTLSLLEQFARCGNREAAGTIAYFQLNGIGIPKDVQRGRINLLVAARSYDRISARRLALYYKMGLYGFKEDEKAAEYWRDRTTKWLRSDASLCYDDPQLKNAAVSMYVDWKSECKKYWGISIHDN